MHASLDDKGLPYLLCPKCGHISPGWNQTRKICTRCLMRWLEEQGLPVMEYARKGEE